MKKRNSNKTITISEAHVNSLNHLTAVQKLRILQNLLQRLIIQSYMDLETSYEDMAMHHAPSECFADARKGNEQYILKTMHYWCTAMFAIPAIRSELIYGAHYITMVRSNRRLFHGYKAPPFSDIISYIQYALPDGFIKFVYEASEHGVYGKDQINNAKKYFDLYWAADKKVDALQEVISNFVASAIKREEADESLPNNINV